MAPFVLIGLKYRCKGCCVRSRETGESFKPVQPPVLLPARHNKTSRSARNEDWLHLKARRDFQNGAFKLPHINQDFCGYNGRGFAGLGKKGEGY